MAKPQPLSPELRMEVARLDELTDQATLLGRNHIETLSQLQAFMDASAYKILSLEKEHQKCYNKLKTVKTPESEAELRAKAKDITDCIRPLRTDLRTAKKALGRSEYLAGLVKTEHNMEVNLLDRQHSRQYERDRGRER